MLRKYLPFLLIPDANDGGSAAEEKSSNSEGGIEESPTSQDRDAPSDGQSLSEFLASRKDGDDKKEEEKGDEVPEDEAEAEGEGQEGDVEGDEAGKESSSKTEGDQAKEEESEGEEEASADEKEKGNEGEEKTDEKVEKKDDGSDLPQDKPVPYDRFKEVIAERNNLRTERATNEEAVKNFNAIKSFCERSSISPADYKQALEVQAMLSTGDVDGALKVLGPIVDELRAETGDVLPTDLQTKVDEGRLELEDAKELAKARGTKKVSTAMAQRREAHQRQQAEQQVYQQLQNASRDWDAQKRKDDPDYRPKAKADLPDGKFEKVVNKFIAVINYVDEKGQRPNEPRSAQDMARVMDWCYGEVNKEYLAMATQKPATRKILTSDKSSTTTKTSKQGDEYIADAPTMAEGVSRFRKQRK